MIKSIRNRAKTRYTMRCKAAEIFILLLESIYFRI